MAVIRHMNQSQRYVLIRMYTLTMSTIGLTM